MGVKLSDGRTFHVISPWSMSLPFSSVTLAIAGQRSSFKWVADLTVDETRAIIRELQEALGDAGSSDAERAIAALPDAVVAAVGCDHCSYDGVCPECSGVGLEDGS